MERRKPNYASATVMVLFGLILGWAITHWFWGQHVDQQQVQQLEQQQQMEQIIEQLAINLQKIKASKGDWIEGAKPQLLDESIELADQIEVLNKQQDG
ncbi:hypothetical protein GCM10011369_00510 [Neiella marina]|uniref:Uncharacterized protein n=1 Tax=Neiella marina TaxID=508461 RepID=A0A8J2U1J6_9GAMM|nr:hypothetical protein [Neiella marina]GGA63110.1 hypothetical protein GCM10011369_00510 [Neiella marina]